MAVIFLAFRDAVRLPELEERERLAKQSNRELHFTVQQELEAAQETMEWLTELLDDFEIACEKAGFEAQCLLATKDQLVAGELKSFETWTGAA